MTMTTSKTSVEVRLYGLSTATIDWGDGTSATTCTFSDSWINSNHTYAASSTHTITIAGENIMNLDCQNNQLTALDVNNNTALTGLSCGSNQLTATALNNLFGTLHSNTIEGGKNIYIGDNDGTGTCDTSIATNKGWTVYNI